MKNPKRLPLTAARLLLMFSMAVLLMGTARGPSAGTLGDVRLITGDVLELEFSNPVLNDAFNKLNALFIILFSCYL
jgi:hypothetical protein